LCLNRIFQKSGSSYGFSKKILALVILFCCLIPGTAKGDQTLNSIQVIKHYFDDINQNQWEKATSWWVEEQRQVLLHFISNKVNQQQKLGLLNIKESKLVRWKELSYENGKNYLPNRYMEKFANPRVFYVGVHLKVHTQNEFFIDGVNYFLMAMVEENGEWKIALIPIAPVQSIIYDGYGFGTEDEKTYHIRRLKYY
jgi:hypothetical protein